MPNGARLEQRQRAQMEASDEILVYRTSQGDTLKGLAKRWFANPEDWRRAMALNKIKDPDSIPAGTPLRLRSVWLKTNPITAELVAFRGDVHIVRKSAGLPVMKGMALSEGDIVETGPNGYATLTLPDRSQVSLPSASRIRLARLRQVPMSSSIDRRFTLEQGRSEARVTPMANPASRFLITTPVAVAAVRGTQYVVTYTPSDMKALTVVTEGKVAVQRLGGIEDVLVRAGFGNLTTRSGTTRPIALLPAPAVEMPERVQDSKTVAFRIKPVTGAVRYRVEIASDAGFVDRVGSIEVDGLLAEFEGVADGSYHVRAFALDAMGLSGMVAEPVRFERSWAGNAPGSAERRQAERREQIADLATEQPGEFNWFDGGSGGLLYAANAGFAPGSPNSGNAAGELPASDGPILPVDSTPLFPDLFQPGFPDSGGENTARPGQGGNSPPGNGGRPGGGSGPGNGPGPGGGSAPGGFGPGGGGGPGPGPGTGGGSSPDGTGTGDGQQGGDATPSPPNSGGGTQPDTSTGDGRGPGTIGGCCFQTPEGSLPGPDGGSGSPGNGGGGNTDNSGPAVIGTDPTPPPGAPAPPVDIGQGSGPPTLPGGGPAGLPVVPEPATWALLISGFGLVGFALRRARSSRARQPRAR